jgi:hypothetical protein
VSEESARRVIALEARVRELEAERRRVFEDAQREADAVFAQYQLSQLLAAGGRVDEIAAAVLAEVARAAGAAGAALWLASPSGPALALVATFPGDPDDPGRGGGRPAAGAGSRFRKAGPWAATSRGRGRRAPSGTWRFAATASSPWSPTTRGTWRRCAWSWR